MKNNIKRINYARNKDNFAQNSMTCLDCMQKGKHVTLVFKDIDALL